MELSRECVKTAEVHQEDFISKNIINRMLKYEDKYEDNLQKEAKTSSCEWRIIWHNRKETSERKKEVSEKLLIS